MIAAALLAASVLTPAGVTATIQADPVCLPVTAQPGSTYELTVSASAGTLAVTPAHGTLERRLHQVPPSWVSSGPSSPALLGPDQEPGASVTVRLDVPPGAAPGAYWSDIRVSAGSGSGGVTLGAAATTALVFTVGPSATPPPPCDALDLAQSTGKFPAWPTKAFATSSWKQVFAQEGAPVPDGPPTASPDAREPQSRQSAAQFAPASPAASQGSAGSGKDLIGWALIAGVVLYVLSRIFRRKRSS